MTTLKRDRCSGIRSRAIAALLLAVTLARPVVVTAKTKRSRAARDAFKKEHPCPATGKSRGPCRCYVIDHIVPLKRGGADASSTMQWQTKAEANAKDKWE